MDKAQSASKLRMNEKAHLLFSYGTLQLENVQLENYGRTLKGEKDKLLGYRLESLSITQPDVILKSGSDTHPIAVKSGYLTDSVEGMVFELSENELKTTDKYEVSQYQRILETLASGKTAWIYVDKNVVL